MHHIKLLTASCGCAVGFQRMRSHKSDCAARARACVRQVFKGAHGTQEATSLSLRVGHTKIFPHTTPFIHLIFRNNWNWAPQRVYNTERTIPRKVCTPRTRQGHVLLLSTSPPPKHPLGYTPRPSTPHTCLFQFCNKCRHTNGFGTKRTNVAQA